MRLIKSQNTNQRSIYGKGVKYDHDNQILLDSERVLRVPVGNTDQRPGSLSVSTAASDGHVRYNTDSNQLEAYQNGAWRNIRFKEPNRDPGITIQNIGTGDEIETVFGELNSGDTSFPVPDAAENILVFIENVYQIPYTNYNLKQTAEVNLSGPSETYTESDTGWWIEFTSSVPFGKQITVLHNFDK